MHTVKFKVEGMHCGGCAQIIRSLLEKKEGVRAADVSFEQAEARILFEPEAVSTDELAAAIAKAGYRVADGS